MKGLPALKQALIFLLLISIFTPTSSKRQKRQGNGGLREWQTQYLQKIQIQAREAGLPKEVWEGIIHYDSEVCYEKACLTSALEILEAANLTVNPCAPELWLTYVCSRRVNGPDNINQPERLMMLVEQQTKEILKSKSKQISGEFLLTEAQTYYYQCTHKALSDEEDVKTILQHAITKYGEWPMMTNRDPGPRFNWLEMVADMNRIERPGYSPLLLSVNVDRLESDIRVDMGQMSFPITGDDFTAMMRRLQRASGTNRPARLDQLQGMLQFINSASYATLVTSFNPSYSIEELQERTDQYFQRNNLLQFKVDWLDFFKRVFNGSDIEVTGQRPRVSLPFQKVMSLMKSVNLALARNESRSVANALHFHFASTLLLETTTYLDDLNSFRCREQSGDRESICYSRTTEIFGYSLGKTYLKLYYNDKKETPAIEALMAKIKQGYVDVIDSTEWMQNATKEYLKDKVRSTRAYIAQPDWTKDPKQLRQFYRTLHASSDRGSSYPLNYLAVTSWAYMKKMSWGYKLSQLTSVRDMTIYDMEWSRYLGTVQAQARYKKHETLKKRLRKH